MAQQTIGGYPVHPAAQLFPLMQGEEFDALVEDVRQRGLVEAVVLHEKQILDGRNRLLACIEAKAEPKFKEWKPTTPEDNPWLFVLGANIKRRHLPAGQRAVITVKVLRGLESWQELQENRKESANKARSDSAKTRPRTSDGRRLSSGPQECGPLDKSGAKPRKKKLSTSKLIADIAGVGSRTVEYTLELEENDPDKSRRSAREK